MEKKVRSVARRLVRLFATRDPFKIAEALGIQIRFVELNHQKGFCKHILRNFFIFINSNLSREMQIMACAHELGHVLFHKDYLVDDQVLLEMDTYDPKNRTEYEANLFAASLLVDEDELRELLLSGADLPPAEAFIFIMKDGDDVMAVGMEYGQVTAVESITFAPENTINWVPTITAQDGGLHFISEEG